MNAQHIVNAVTGAHTPGEAIDAVQAIIDADQRERLASEDYLREAYATMSELLPFLKAQTHYDERERRMNILIDDRMVELPHQRVRRVLKWLLAPDIEPTPGGVS